MGRDSVAKTFLVALVLCVVCSVLVSSAAVLLRPRQRQNQRLDAQKNILQAAGLVEAKASRDEVNTVFDKRMEKILVDLDSGDIVPDSSGLYESYDPREAADAKETSTAIETTGPTPGVDRREKRAFVYKVHAEGNPDSVEQYVLPVYGKGLWSTMYGFLAVDADGRTIRGITFYKDGETPGLGGEINNPGWKARWSDPDSPKYAYDDEGDVAIQVIKGTVNNNSSDAAYKVDGLSGATITTRGVSNLVQYWLGSDGFGPFLNQQTGGVAANVN